MPLYEFQCKECDKKDARFLHIEERNDAQVCGICRGGMVRLISRPQIITSPHHLRDENKIDAYKSKDEIREERAQEDAAYEKSWGHLSLPDTSHIRPDGPTLMDIPMSDKPADAETLRWLQGGEG